VTAHGVQADHVLKPGLPADSITSYVAQQGFDLMIMGTHGRRGISHVLLGSIAGAMLRLASCPVLTVRQFDFGAGHERVVPLGNT
jgi:nucleotide-binding universal stress UspA family protein